ncbi:hypothetical protein GMSM_25180 [Geomonas sp. Red276]
MDLGPLGEFSGIDHPLEFFLTHKKIITPMHLAATWGARRVAYRMPQVREFVNNFLTERGLTGS